jgi:uncharacterized protein with HEPN domain
VLFDAVLFNLEVIGEAVKKLPEAAKVGDSRGELVGFCKNA